MHVRDFVVRRSEKVIGHYRLLLATARATTRATTFIVGSIGRLLRMCFPQCIRPPLRQKVREQFAAFRLNQGVLVPGFCRVDIGRCRHDIEVASEDNRCAVLRSLAAWRLRRFSQASLLSNFGPGHGFRSAHTDRRPRFRRPRPRCNGCAYPWDRRAIFVA
jgi:hypothetical protein